MKVFYVCSWGGCGSKVLCRYLNKFGKAVHIHDPHPPQNLEYVGFNDHSRWGWCPYELPEYEKKNRHICNRGLEWFNSVRIDDEHEYYVIFLYRNPVCSIKSRFWARNHIENIKSPPVSIREVCADGKDMFKLESFYNNYMNPQEPRSYDVYAVKYEELFDKIEELDHVLGINVDRKLTLEFKTETNRGSHYIRELSSIYRNLNERMTQNAFIVKV